MTQGFDPNCPACWPILDCLSDGGPLEEVFSWGHGLAVYDVDRAREMVRDGRKVWEVDTNTVAGWVSYTGDTVKFNVLANAVRPEHIDHVTDSVNDPVIFAYAPKPREEGQKRAILPIDGNHRIARAIKYHQPVVYAVALTEEETDSILTDNRPRKARKKPC